MNNALRNGIKPTRLWHKTGQKHFQSLIKDREGALKRPLDARERQGGLQLIGVALLSTVVMAYTYGAMSCKKHCKACPKKSSGSSSSEHKSGSKPCRNSDK